VAFHRRATQIPRYLISDKPLDFINPTSAVMLVGDGRAGAKRISYLALFALCSSPATQDRAGSRTLNRQQTTSPEGLNSSINVLTAAAQSGCKVDLDFIQAILERKEIVLLEP
jgi:hypothetical protein